MAIKLSPLKTYYRLTKPGIIYGNAFTALAGFCLASKGQIDWGLLAAAIFGLSLIIASACVFNNYFDRSIDARMARTKKRALVAGTISAKNAIIYAVTLGLVGSFLLVLYTNWLSLLVALFGFIVYIFFYTFGKRRTVHGTIIGSLAGAVPPVVGYTAVTDRLDGAALLLFLVLVCWQMPHFYSIAIYRSSDYADAKIPVLPLIKGLEATKRQILGYIIAFLTVASLLFVYGYTGYIYLAMTVLLAATWTFLFTQNTKKADGPWARQMFRFSLIVITAWSIVLSLNAWLP